MPDLAPSLADRARRLRASGRLVKDIAAELGVSVRDVKRATTPGFAERERERWRRQDEARREARKVSRHAYAKDYYERTKALSATDARHLAERLKERRRQRGLDQAAAAKDFGVTLSAYQRWEAGLCPRSDIRLVGLALRGLDSPKLSSSGSRFDPHGCAATAGE